MANGFVSFSFLTVDEDDLIVENFVDGILSESFAKCDGFSSGAGDSKSGLGMVLTLTGHWKGFPPGIVNALKKESVVFGILLVGRNFSTWIVCGDDEEVIWGVGAIKGGDELSLMIFLLH